jgi:2-methylcitrate dehydratase
MVVSENRDFSRDYLDPGKRAIGNAVQVFFKDGTSTPRVAIEYPVGHRRRRSEGIPLLLAKFRQNLATQLHTAQMARIEAACGDQAELEALPVDEFVSLWVKQA